MPRVTGPRSAAPGLRSSTRLFLPAVVALLLVEFANVWFVMPLPGSQRMRSVEVAYAIYQWRWVARAVVGIALAVGLVGWWRAGGWRRWMAPMLLAVVGGVAWMVNFRMAADRMFEQPRTLILAPSQANTVARDRLVVGVEVNGTGRAYPLQFIGYHHHVRDTVGGEPIMVSYCTVCRTGRVFSPLVDGEVDKFRLVGMDHFNAMFEDARTGSWWRQANGEAVTGPLKGRVLRELPSLQVTLGEWLALHPTSLVMQADPVFVGQYARDYAFENGTSRSTLTGTDTSSWGDKSWVVGISIAGQAKAFDWNRLKRERVINDEVGGRPVVLVLANDGASFYAYERPQPELVFSVVGDSLMAGGTSWPVSGQMIGGLRRIPASQEFWHSWREFNPGTTRATGS